MTSHSPVRIPFDAARTWAMVSYVMAMLTGYLYTEMFVSEVFVDKISNCNKVPTYYNRFRLAR
jgi:hypothetical protein